MKNLILKLVFITVLTLLCISINSCGINYHRSQYNHHKKMYVAKGGVIKDSVITKTIELVVKDSEGKDSSFSIDVDFECPDYSDLIKSNSQLKNERKKEKNRHKEILKQQKNESNLKEKELKFNHEKSIKELKFNHQQAIKDKENELKSEKSKNKKSKFWVGFWIGITVSMLVIGIIIWLRVKFKIFFNKIVSLF